MRAFRVDFETERGAASALAQTFVYNLPTDYFQTYADRVHAVTAILGFIDGYGATITAWPCSSPFCTSAGDASSSLGEMSFESYSYAIALRLDATSGHAQLYCSSTLPCSSKCTWTYAGKGVGLTN